MPRRPKEPMRNSRPRKRASRHEFSNAWQHNDRGGLRQGAGRRRRATATAKIAHGGYAWYTSEESLIVDAGRRRSCENGRSRPSRPRSCRCSTTRCSERFPPVGEFALNHSVPFKCGAEYDCRDMAIAAQEVQDQGKGMSAKTAPAWRRAQQVLQVDGRVPRAQARGLPPFRDAQGRDRSSTCRSGRRGWVELHVDTGHVHINGEL